MVKVIAVCTSGAKGTRKTCRPQIRLLRDWGVSGDAHAGHWHRQVSLLSYEQIEALRSHGADVDCGAFGENITLSGSDLKLLPVGTRILIGDCVLEVSQIGKKCHDRCEISRKLGTCIMPREGIFAVVVRGGIVMPGDEARVEAAPPDEAVLKYLEAKDE